MSHRAAEKMKQHQRTVNLWPTSISNISSFASVRVELQIFPVIYQALAGHKSRPSK